MKEQILLSWLQQAENVTYLCIPAIAQNGASYPKERAARYRKELLLHRTILITEGAFWIVRIAPVLFFSRRTGSEALIPFPSLPG